MKIGTSLIADTPVPVQLQIIDAAVIRSQGIDHSLLLLLLSFLPEHLLLQSKALLHLLMLDPVFRLRGFLFKGKF